MRTTEPKKHLTPTEAMCLEQLLEGKSNEQIAAALGIKLSTVKIHLQHVRECLGGTDQGERWWVKLARARGRIEGRAR